MGRGLVVVVLKGKEGGREGERYREKERKEERTGRRQRGRGEEERQERKCVVRIGGSKTMHRRTRRGTERPIGRECSLILKH